MIVYHTFDSFTHKMKFCFRKARGTQCRQFFSLSLIMYKTLVINFILIYMYTCYVCVCQGTKAIEGIITSNFNCEDALEGVSFNT